MEKKKDGRLCSGVFTHLLKGDKIGKRIEMLKAPGDVLSTFHTGDLQNEAKDTIAAIVCLNVCSPKLDRY